MGLMCAVYGCGTTSKNKHGISTHVFPPKSSQYRRQWIQFVKNTRHGFTEPTKYQGVCGLHFESSCFADEFTFKLKQQAGFRRYRQLNADAVPTVLTQACLDALSKHSASASATRLKQKEESQRVKRSRQRELLKSITAEKRARVDEFSCSTSDTDAQQSATSSCSASTSQCAEDDTIGDLRLSTPSEPPEIPTVSECNPNPRFKDAGVGKVYHHRSSMANMKPHKRSKAVSIKPKTRSFGTQCDLHSCDCSDAATSQNPSSSKLLVKLPVPLRSSSPIPTTLNDTVDLVCDCDSEADNSEADLDDSEYEPHAEFEDEDDEEINIANTFPDLPSVLPHEERKYIVFEASLLQLFKLCPCCRGPGKVVLSELGTFLKVVFTCSECDHTFEWFSQPVINKMPVGNLLLSASVLFTGCLLSKVFRLLDSMNIAHHTQKTFYQHQRKYLQPTIVNKWLSDQYSLLETAASMEGGLVLSGDGRSDSPGHSAKYGGFNVIECRLNKVIHIEVVQSNEVGNSARCENEGLKRTFQFLSQAGLQVDVIITDRHKANQKTIREELKVRHYFDIWHVAKSVTKKLNQLAKQRNMETVSLWRRSIVNHLYWVAASTPDGDGETMVAKWLSLINHIANKHQGHGDLLLRMNHHVQAHYQGHLFPACLHQPLQEADRRKLWFTPDSKEHEAVCKVVEDKHLLKDVRKLSPLYQTSALEAFHSLVVQFCPKHTSFSWLGMYCRLFLAAMHFNENSNRAEEIDAAGKTKFTVHFPKVKKGDYSIKIIKQDPTYEYIKILTQELFKKYAEDPAALAGSLPTKFKEKPNALTASFHHPDADEAWSTYIGRFAKS